MPRPMFADLDPRRPVATPPKAPAQLSGMFRPLHSFVVVRRERDSERVGGLWVPDSARDALHVGRVVAAGRGRDERAHHRSDGSELPPGVFCAKQRNPIDLRQCERVVYYPRAADMRHGTAELHAGDEVLLVMKEDDVFAVVDDEGNPTRAMAGRVLVRRDREAERIGTIFAPSLAKRETSLRAGRGTVIAVGRFLDSSVSVRCVNVGDVVHFKPEAGLVRQWKGEEIVVMGESQIDGVES